MPSSGLLPFVESVLNTTPLLNGLALINPTNPGTAQGTPQTATTYPLAYGSYSMAMATPRVFPASNSIMTVNATAPPSTSLSASTVYGASQGNCLNPCSMVECQISDGYTKLYQNVLTLAAYIPSRF
jgi:hypothetical protein